jgi:hypothetical protein
VAGPTLTQRVEELTKEVQRVQSALETYKQLSDLKLRILEDQAAERTKVEDDLKSKIADLTAKTRYSKSGPGTRKNSPTAGSTSSKRPLSP